MIITENSSDKLANLTKFSETDNSCVKITTTALTSQLDRKKIPYAIDCQKNLWENLEMGHFLYSLAPQYNLVYYRYDWYVSASLFGAWNNSILWFTSPQEPRHYCLPRHYHVSQHLIHCLWSAGKSDFPGIHARILLLLISASSLTPSFLSR